MKLSYKDPNKENWFLVSWTLSNKCNYRCSYCPDALHNGSTGHPDWDLVSNFVENFSVPGKEICYRLSGGEPTYWKHFIDLAKLVKSKGHTFSFLTNGSKDTNYFKEINPYTDGLIISYHPEYADIDHFVNIAKVMDCFVAVNLMMVPEEFDSLVKIAETLYNSADNIVVWPKLILDKSANLGHITNAVTDYSKDQITLLDNWPYFRKIDDSRLHRGDLLLDNVPVTANKLILNNLNQHFGWHCWAGLHMINIDMWGDIYRADCKQGGPIGTLKEYSMPVEPIICAANKCSCLSDIYLQKQRL